MEVENPTKASSSPRHCESNHEMLPQVGVISLLILLQGVENNDFKRKIFLCGANTGLIKSSWVDVYHICMGECCISIVFLFESDLCLSINCIFTSPVHV